MSLRNKANQRNGNCNGNGRVNNPLGAMGWIKPTDGKLKPPPSKGPGTHFDRNVRVVVNHLPATIKPRNSVFYQYDVDIDLALHCKIRKAEKKGGGGGDTTKKDPPKSNLWLKVILQLIRAIEEQDPPGSLTDGTINPMLATDGSKAIYTAYPIKHLGADNTRTLQIDLADTDEYEGNNVVYDVTITLVKQDELTEEIKTFFLNMKRHYDFGNGTPDKMADLTRIISTALRTESLRTETNVQVGSCNFFSTLNDDGFSLGGGLENWNGFSLTCTMGWKPFVTIDLANCVFIAGKKVLDVVREILIENNEKGVIPNDVTTWTKRTFSKVGEVLVGTKVRYWAINGKPMERKVTRLCQVTARECTFTIQNGKKKEESNVEKYFGGPNQLRVSNGLCLEFGEKSIVPAELCRIVKGQPFTKKLSDKQTGKMIRDTAKSPAARFAAIEKTIQTLNLNENKTLAEFGVEVDEALAKITARVLPVPSLAYQDGSKAQVHKVTPLQNGTWSNSNGSKSQYRFKAPFQMPNNKPTRYGIMNLSDVKNGNGVDRQKTVEFLKGVTKQARDLGLNLEDAKIYEEMQPDENKFRIYLNNNRENFKLVFVILGPDENKKAYSMVKSVAETLCSTNSPVLSQKENASHKQAEGQSVLLTQCLKSGTVEDNKTATHTNIVLKLNMKLGGVNYGLLQNAIYPNIDILSVPTLVLGADVTHPAAGSSMPSIAAVTASLDRTGMPFRAHIQAQSIPLKGAAEVILGLDIIVRKMIVLFVTRTGYIPRRIIMYRDGVGNSQFDDVLAEEMLKIRDACTRFWDELAKVSTERFKTKEEVLKKSGLKLSDAYEPKITFVAVQKRHKTRIFLDTSEPGDTNAKVANTNAPPGTVIDTHIVSPANIDFYLLSHIGIQGTSRPTRYQVLHDDSDFSIDELELLTYYLCFCYGRCTRSVSYPAPTYYAHLAAFRGRIFIDHLMAKEGRKDLTDDVVDDYNTKIARNEDLLKFNPMHYV